MPYIEPPNGYTAAAKAYAKRQYQAQVQDINNAQAGQVVSRMPPKPTKGLYYFTQAIPGDPIITKPGAYAYNGSSWVGNIDEQTWPSARIGSLSADKITSGTNTAAEIILNGANAKIKSSNYVAGSSGFQIKGDGSAEFQNVTVRGTMWADDIKFGSLSEARLGTDSIGARPLAPGVLHTQNGLTSDLSLPNSVATTVGSWSYSSGGIIVPANTYRSGVVIILTLGNPSQATTATSGGHVFGQIARGTNTNVLNGSQVIIQLSQYYYSGNSNDTTIKNSTPKFTINQSVGFVTNVFYEPVSTVGTGQLTYFLRAHQCIVPLGNATIRANWILMEFSKS